MRAAAAVHMTDFLQKHGCAILGFEKPDARHNMRAKLAFTRDVDLGSWRHEKEFLN